MVWGKLFTSLLLALSMTVGYSPQTKSQCVSEEPVFAAQQESRDDSDCLGNIKPSRAYIVSKLSGQDIADEKPKHATLEQKVELYAVLEAKVGRERVYFTDAPKIKLRGERINQKQIKKMPLCSDLRIEWLKIEPRGNNYAYVRKDNPIDYQETFFSSGSAVEADVHPTILSDQFKDIPQGVGVMHYRLKIETSKSTFSTPGTESRQLGGLSDRVHRVSYRPNTKSWMDFAFELFGTPYIWGSRKEQVDQQMGSDCADLVVYAKRREEQEKSGNPRAEYTWSKGLRSRARTILITKVYSKDYEHLIDERGNPLLFGNVKKGDIIYYPPINGIGHVTILYRDSGVKGYLDCGDLIIQTLAHEPEIITLCKAYGIPEEILRWR